RIRRHRARHHRTDPQAAREDRPPQRGVDPVSESDVRLGRWILDAIFAELEEWTPERRAIAYDHMAAGRVSIVVSSPEDGRIAVKVGFGDSPTVLTVVR